MMLVPGRLISADFVPLLLLKGSDSSQQPFLLVREIET
jgi:hypothetical protein